MERSSEGFLFEAVQVGCGETSCRGFIFDFMVFS